MGSHMKQPRRTLRFFSLASILGTALAQDACVSDKGTDSNTSWLGKCATDSACDGGLVCLCGTCTTACNSEAECDAFGSAASCVTVDGDDARHACGMARVSLCTVACMDGTACTTGETSCIAGACLAATSTSSGGAGRSGGNSGGAGGNPSGTGGNAGDAATVPEASAPPACTPERAAVEEIIIVAGDAATTLSCEFGMPQYPGGEPFDPQRVSVAVKLPGLEEYILANVDDGVACGLSVAGWYYDDAAIPTKILLCPGTCASFLPGQINASNTDVLFECSAPAPDCVSGADCTTPLVCDPSGLCVECVMDSDCPLGPFSCRGGRCM
jgi:hypothetical protein